MMLFIEINKNYKTLNLTHEHMNFNLYFEYYFKYYIPLSDNIIFNRYLLINKYG